MTRSQQRALQVRGGLFDRRLFWRGWMAPWPDTQNTRHFCREWCNCWLERRQLACEYCLCIPRKSILPVYLVLTQTKLDTQAIEDCACQGADRRL